MAELLQLSVEADKGAIHVFDKTGKYQKKCNEGGWGDPNLRVTDITKAEISVFPPGASEPISVVDVYPVFPNDSGIGFEILAQDLGLEKIISGIWKFEYRASNDDGVSLAATCYALFDAVVECCIEKRKAGLDPYDASSDANKKTVELETLLDNARWAACEGLLDQAQKIITYIDLQCKCCS